MGARGLPIKEIGSVEYLLMNFDRDGASLSMETRAQCWRGRHKDSERTCRLTEWTCRPCEVNTTRARTVNERGLGYPHQLSHPP